MATKLDIELIGNIFDSNNYGKFKVLSKHLKSKDGHYTYNIEFIDTGYKVAIRYDEIKRGKIKDYLKPIINDVACLGYATKKDNIKAYKIWHSMIDRCYNKSRKDYINYGGRGVFVCDRWLIFQNFLEDFINIDGYNEKLLYENKIHLDKDCKIDNNLEYSFDNCKFVTIQENLRHTRNSKKFKATSPDGIEYFGKCQREFSEIHNIPFWTLSRRLKDNKIYNGWSFQYV